MQKPQLTRLDSDGDPTLWDTISLEIGISRENLYRGSFYLGFASALTILISITASQYLLGISLAMLLASRKELRLPPIWLPLMLFLVGTVISLVFSPAPMHGIPQIVKIFVFSILLVIFSTVHEAITARHLVLGWVGIAAVGSVVGVAQFAHRVYKAQVQNLSFYQFYTGDRITGFMSHWMTFAGQGDGGAPDAVSATAVCTKSDGPVDLDSGVVRRS